jgi:hypothetical protein
MNIKNENLKRYHENGFSKVEGWCEEELFYTIDLLSSLPINQHGGICEIGVHHGKLYILLNQIVDINYKSYAIDIFENQSLNIDGSGHGHRPTFEHNVFHYDVHQGRNTAIISGDSTDKKLQLTNYIAPGSIRFFSIDGGHTAAHTINDLQIANECISNEGIVILDDIMNPWWSGVIEGLIKFLQISPTLVPVAMGHNKLYLSKISYQKYYIEMFRNLQISGPKADTNFFGHKIVTFAYHPKLGW